MLRNMLLQKVEHLSPLVETQNKILEWKKSFQDPKKIVEFFGNVFT